MGAVPEALRRLDWVDEMHVVEVPMNTRFRGIIARQAMLVRCGGRWAEWSPFTEYGPAEATNWWRATAEAAREEQPEPVRQQVPVNVTVPALDAARAHERVLASGCSTAKVKVAEAGQGEADDLARVEAVRDALGPGGRVRIDANGAWTPSQALSMIKKLRHLDLEYVEQPCRTVEELAMVRHELARRGWEVRIAADESIRRSGDPERVVALQAADVAVIKVQPLGGVRACLQLAQRLGLPVVVSSALETSVGLRLGVALAAALPELPMACGLNTGGLLSDDVTLAPVRACAGVIDLESLEVDPEAVRRLAADEVTIRRWHQRLAEVLDHLDDHPIPDLPTP